MDLLGDVLAGLRLESTVFCQAMFTAPWGFSKAALEGAPFHAIIAGRAWIKLSDAPPLELGPGDFVVLPHGDAHQLLGSPRAPATSFTDLLTSRGVELWRPGQRGAGPVKLEYGGGGEATTLVSGVFAFGDRRRNPLITALPRCVHVRGREAAAPWLDTTLRYLADEASSELPGAGAVTARLADILFIQAVRAHLALHPTQTLGWLRGMTDPAIGRALAMLHAEPSHPWSVEVVAREVGLSRSGFAARFQSLVGRGPIEYLTEWRMFEAAGRLSATSLSIVEVAESCGYRSEIAFGKAFKRWSGKPPSLYRRLNMAN